MCGWVGGLLEGSAGVVCGWGCGCGRLNNNTHTNRHNAPHRWFNIHVAGISNPRETLGFFNQGFLSTGTGLITNSSLFAVDAFFAIAGFLAILMFVKELEKVSLCFVRLGWVGAVWVDTSLSKFAHTHTLFPKKTNTAHAPPPGADPPADRAYLADGPRQLAPALLTADPRVRRRPRRLHHPVPLSRVGPALPDGAGPRSVIVREALVAEPSLRPKLPGPLRLRDVLHPL